MARIRKNISISEEQENAINEYDKDHPYAKIELSAILQTALNNILKKEGYLK